LSGKLKTVIKLKGTSPFAFSEVIWRSKVWLYIFFALVVSEGELSVSCPGCCTALKEPQDPSKLTSGFKCDPYEEKINVKFLAYLVDKR